LSKHCGPSSQRAASSRCGYRQTRLAPLSIRSTAVRSALPSSGSERRAASGRDATTGVRLAAARPARSAAALLEEDAPCEVVRPDIVDVDIDLEALEERGDWAALERAARGCLHADPVDAGRALGRALGHLGREEEALAAFAAALARATEADKPDDAERVLVDRGRLYLDRGEARDDPLERRDCALRALHEFEASRDLYDMHKDAGGAWPDALCRARYNAGLAFDLAEKRDFAAREFEAAAQGFGVLLREDRADRALLGEMRGRALVYAGDDRLALDDEGTIRQAAALHRHVAVACAAPGAFLTPWRDAVDAVLVLWPGGQELANALVDVVFGAINPTARLPLTLPASDNDLKFTRAMYPGLVDPDPPPGCADPCLRVHYEERLEVGYRRYDAHRIDPAFAFGHGLSYTRFVYANLTVSRSLCSFDVRNVGEVAGAEVAQLYVAPPARSGAPPQQLKGFRKTGVLAPGAAERVEFRFDERTFAAWGPGGWRAVTGTHGLRVGASSRDVRLVGTVDV